MSDMNVSVEVRGSVAFITIIRPPVNSLDHATRRALITAFSQVAADPGVDCIVLMGSGGTFCAGADVKELGDVESFFRSPRILDVAQCIEACTKPVIAAIEGNCLGGGLEIALAAHYRVAAASAVLGLPEVKIGVLPASGGTQRLPRLIGLPSALKMMLDGSSLAAREFGGTPLLDLVVEERVAEAAERLAKAVAPRATHPKTSEKKAPIDPDNHLAAAEAALSASRDRAFVPAQRKIIEALRTSVNASFDSGIVYEQDSARELVCSVQSRALRHIFAAERAARKVKHAGVTPRRVESVAVIGSGTMGSGIAITLLDGGFKVQILDAGQDVLDKGIERIRQHYAQAVNRGRLGSAEMAKRLQLLRGTLAYEDLGDADLVIEAVFEDMGVKQRVFANLDRYCKLGAVLATNTSYLDLNQIAGFTTRPGDVVGLHFFSPAHAMRLIEIVRGDSTHSDVLATATKLAEGLKKVSVVAGVCDGFIGNRMFTRYASAALNLVLAGASPAQVDLSLERFGMAMGPFKVGDLAGLDIGHAARKRRAQDAGVPFVPGPADVLVAAGRLGQKSGAGWYKYNPGNRNPLPDAQVEGLVEQFRQSVGVVPRSFTEEEIVQRCVFSLVNEGARILKDGVAERAGDIDLVYLNGYGFPRDRGGPMFYADTVGLRRVADILQSIQTQDPRDLSWAPASLLTTHVNDAQTFTGA